MRSREEPHTWGIPKGTVRAEDSDVLAVLHKELLHEAGSTGMVAPHSPERIDYVKANGEIQNLVVYLVEITSTGGDLERKRKAKWVPISGVDERLRRNRAARQLPGAGALAALILDFAGRWAASRSGKNQS